MNTPTHMVVSYAFLEKQAPSQIEKWSIIIGGLFPDFLIFVLFFYALVVGIPQSELWSSVYFQDNWQWAIDMTNSVPIFAVLILVGWLWKKRAIMLFGLSASIHAVFDFLTHANDAHRHFLPVSDYRFESIVSYWDPAHFGGIGSTLELSLLFVCVWYLYPRLTKGSTKALLISHIALSFAMILAAPFIFG